MTLLDVPETPSTLQSTLVADQELNSSSSLPPQIPSTHLATADNANTILEDKEDNNDSFIDREPFIENIATNIQEIVDDNSLTVNVSPIISNICKQQIYGAQRCTAVRK